MTEEEFMSEKTRRFREKLEEKIARKLAEEARQLEAEQKAYEEAEQALKAEQQAREADIPLWEKYNMTEEEYMSEKNLRFREKLEEKEARRRAEAAGEGGTEYPTLP